MIRNSFGVAFVLLFAAIQGFAQNTNLSPYSRFGIGELNSSGLTHHSGLGGITLPFGSTRLLNPDNPATYALIAKPTFDLGIQNRSVIISNSTASRNDNTTLLRNIAFGTQVAKRWGIGFGLLPVSSVGYEVSSTAFSEDFGSVNFEYTGDGGVNKAYIGAGYSIIDTDTARLSVGFNATYLFGTINHTRRSIFPQNTGFFNTRAQSSTIISDVDFDFGVHYEGYISQPKKIKLLAGFNFNVPAEINAKQTSTTVTYVASPLGIDLIRDTVSHTADIEGRIVLPQRIGFGLGVQIKDRWTIAGQFKVQDWASYEEQFADTITDQLSGSTEFAFGVQYRPKKDLSPNASAFKNGRYRLGFRYAQSYLQLGETQLDEMAFTAGFGLPIARQTSLINFGIEFGERGTVDNNLIREQFTNVYVGLSLSPIGKWFNKRKYN